MKLKKITSQIVSVSIFLSHLQMSAQTTTLSSKSTQSASTLQNLLANRSILKAGSAIFETADLIKLYSIRNFEPIWIRQGQKTEFVDAFKLMVQQISLKHGLITTDYYNSELEAYLKGLNSENEMATELLISQSYIRLASHLSDGRIEPTTIDNDIRFKKRIFSDFTILAQAVSSVPAMMAPIVETLAPEHLYYKNTLAILSQLNDLKFKGGYKNLSNPKVTIKLNSKHAVVAALRERVIQQGYSLTGTGLVYDQELSEAIQDIQKENGYLVNQNLLPDSGVWTLFSTAIDARILQTQATLEKLRWLPKKLEPNMIFVNTNATEMKVYENNEVIKSMATINGRPLRRTPMMQTWVTHVVLNTTWTATDSVVLQDKLPEIQKDVNFLKRIRMHVINNTTGQEVDPTTLDWKNDSRGIAKRHSFVMDPGPKNALGVYKFPLSSDKNTYGSNSDDIFMHFTDDPLLFLNSNRHLSSGCVRLSEAKWFAEYLLQHNPEYTPEHIDSVISKGTKGEVFDSNIKIKLRPEEFRAVYTVPLTVEKTATGHVRFMKDIYLQDRRIVLSALSNSARSDNFISPMTKSSASAGTLTVVGAVGPTQYFSHVVVQKCDQPESTIDARTTMHKLIRKCTLPIKFSLNSAQSLEAGSYIVGFENTIYPGFVNVVSGKNIQIQLQKISVPSSFSAERNIKVYRDMGSLVEQKKVYFQKYFSGQNLFRQTLRSYGDLSIAGFADIDVAVSAAYNYCYENNLNTLVLSKEIREHALFVCETLNAAQGMMDLADLYRFQSNGTYQEATVDYPGDVIPKRYLRVLVGSPMKSGDFVSVMPGVYRMASDTKTSDRINTITLPEAYPNTRRIFAKSRLSLVNTNEVSEGDVQDKSQASAVPTSAADGVSEVSADPVAPTHLGSASNRCELASIWRTEFRSYCIQDTQEGCGRASSILCEEIKLDLRFRK